MASCAVCGVRHRTCPHWLPDAVIRAVPRARAANVRGGAVHAPPGRHTIAIGDTPGSRTAGLLDVSDAGHGNCAAITVVPTATWKVIPFCAGVTVIVPCATLGGDDGRDDGGVVCGTDEGVDGGVGEVGRPEEAGADVEEEAEEEPTPPPAEDTEELADTVPVPVACPAFT